MKWKTCKEDMIQSKLVQFTKFENFIIFKKIIEAEIYHFKIIPEIVYNNNTNPLIPTNQLNINENPLK